MNADIRDFQACAAALDLTPLDFEIDFEYLRLLSACKMTVITTDTTDDEETN